MEHFAIQHKVFLEFLWLNIPCPTHLTPHMPAQAQRGVSPKSREIKGNKLKEYHMSTQSQEQRTITPHGALSPVTGRDGHDRTFGASEISGDSPAPPRFHCSTTATTPPALPHNPAKSHWQNS